MTHARNIRNDSQGVDIDCMTCIHRSECESAAEGTFCTRWQSRQPETREPDPNTAWERGEDAAF